MKSLPKRLLLLLVSGLVVWLLAEIGSYLLHDHWDRLLVATLADGSKLEVRSTGSKRHYFGGGHGLGFGGGDRQERLDFEWHGQRHVWEGIYEPVALQFDGETPLVIVFDRESDHGEWGLRYYRRDKDWVEMPVSSFPPRLALLNLWGHDPSQFRRCDPQSRNFQDGLTADLWMCIATGKSYQEAKLMNVTPEFLAEFKQSIVP